MSEYQVLARKYRPQRFSDVLGQEAIVTTLKNAIKRNSIAHAYLFCGTRGTGKTTLARLFAKALNCQNPSTDFEPCNLCSSCKEIIAGHSLDVLEIDGASHRGIDDIRQINETVGYAAASGKYKIYIIDEVHMLTKEAFNALLKTLEEPPPKVKFLFATTEPHKVLATILSRCQRLSLNRIPLTQIVNKLQRITTELSVNVEEKALYLIANRAEGSLRDAESLLDQIIAFHEGNISEKVVADVLGIMTRDSLFELDLAGKEGNLAVAFEIAHQLFSQGKDVIHFLESLTEHYRLLLMLKLSGKDAPFLSIAEQDRQKYETSASFYSQEQCLTILDLLIEAHSRIRFSPSGRVILEATLLRIMRTHHRIPIDYLIRRLAEIEQNPDSNPPASTSTSTQTSIQQKHSDSNQQIAPANTTPINKPAIPPVLSKETAEEKIKNPPKKASSKTIDLENISTPTPKVIPSSLTEDPTPSKADLGAKEKSPRSPSVSSNSSGIINGGNSGANDQKKAEKIESMPVELGARLTEEAKADIALKQSHYDTLLQFAAVELEGTIQKKQINRR